MTDRKSQARHIVDLLGGRSEAQRITGLPMTMIEGWLRHGWIQQRHHRLILEKAWAEDKPINELDFVVHLRGATPAAVTSPERAAG